MGGKGSGRLTKEAQLVRTLSPKPKKVSGNLTGNFIIPNLSGDHSAGWTKTPVKDTDLVNKKYVDDHAGNPAGSDGQIQFNDNGSFGASSDLVWDNTNKRLGIGTTNPNAILSLGTTLGNKLLLYDGGNKYGFGIQASRFEIFTDDSGAEFKFGIGTSNNFTKTLLDIKGNGYVGIGTTSPTKTLDVNGVTRFRNNITIDGDKIIQRSGIDRIRFYNLYLDILNTALRLNGNTIYGDAASGGNLTLESTSNATKGYVQSNDEFRAPKFVDSVGTSFYLDPDSSATSLKIAGNISMPTGKYIGIDGTDIVIQGSGDVLYLKGKAGIYLQEYNAGWQTRLMIQDTTGNVGINTTNPAAKLDLAGDARIGDGTNYAEFKDDGELNLHGTARVRRNVEIAIGSIKPPATHPASWADLGIAGAWEFSDGTTETVILEMPLPLDIDRSEDVVVDIGWASPATSKNCVWELSYLLRSENEAIDASADDTLSQTVASSSTSNGLVKTSFTIPSSDISSTDLILILKLERKGGDANDTLSDSAYLTTMNFNYVSNKLGEAL